MRVVVLVKSTQRLPEEEQQFEELAPCDFSALTWARELVGASTELTVLTAGPPTSDTILRRALQLGADRACRVWLTSPEDAQEIQTNPRAIAELLAVTVRKLGYDLVLAGSRSADWNSCVTATAVAFNLGVPHITGATEVAATASNDLRVVQRREGNNIALRLTLPALVTTCALSPTPLASRVPGRELPEIEILDDVDLAFEFDDPNPHTDLPAHDVEPSSLQRVADSHELLETIRSLSFVP